MRKPRVKKRYLTTSEAAALLEVSGATLKRWAQEGLVGSERTEGGHRRFLRTALEALARAPAGAHDRAAAQADELLAAGTAIEMQALLLRGRASAGSWAAFGDTLRPGVIDLHRRRQAGRLTTVEWLAVLDRMRSALGRIADHVAGPPGGPAVLVVSAPGDRVLHTPSLAALVAAEAGWAARPGGPAWPAELAPELRRRHADALLATASADVEPEVAGRLALELAGVARTAGTALGLAGLGPWPEPTAGALRLHSFAETRAWLERLRAAGAAPAVEAPLPGADPLAWDPSLRLGDPSIDAQHQVLFRTAGAFIAAVRRGAAEPETARLLAFVEDYAAVHFRSEEHLMRVIGYPRVEEHVWEHEQFTRRLRARGAAAGPAQARALADLLEAWLSEHVRGSDQRLGEHLRRHGSAPDR